MAPNREPDQVGKRGCAGSALFGVVIEALAFEYDVETDKLRSANKTPARSCIIPDRFDSKSSPYYFPHDPDPPLIGPQPVKPEPVRPKGPRPGWA